MLTRLGQDYCGPSSAVSTREMACEDSIRVTLLPWWSTHLAVPCGGGSMIYTAVSRFINVTTIDVLLIGTLPLRLFRHPRSSTSEDSCCSFASVKILSSILATCPTKLTACALFVWFHVMMYFQHSWQRLHPLKSQDCCCKLLPHHWVVYLPRSSWHQWMPSELVYRFVINKGTSEEED